MVRKLNSRDLTDYLAIRINEHSRKLAGQTQAVLKAEVKQDSQGPYLEVINHASRLFYVRASYVPGETGNPDSVEIGIESHFAGVSERDFAGFLEEYITDDRIYKQRMFPDKNIPGPLHTQRPRIDVLQRRDSPGKMKCLVVDERAGDERVRKAVYDYMVRPGIFYMLKKAGDYSKS